MPEIKIVFFVDFRPPLLLPILSFISTLYFLIDSDISMGNDDENMITDGLDTPDDNSDPVADLAASMHQK